MSDGLSKMHLRINTFTYEVGAGPGGGVSEPDGGGGAGGD